MGAMTEAINPLGVTASSNGHDAIIIEDVDFLRDVIFSSDDIVSELVRMPEWGNKELEVRAMTGDERAAYLAVMQSNAPGGDMAKINWRTLYPSLLAATVFSPARNAEGEWLPGTSDRKVFRPDDVDKLNAKSSKAIERLARKAQELSGLRDDEDEEAA